MYLRVFPILRLPRRFGVFDYELPPGLQADVGDLVHVPFHNRQILAVVAAVTDTTLVRSKIAQVTDVAFPSALSPSDVTRLVNLAKSIAQSASTIFLSTFGTLKNEQSAPRLVSSNNRSLTLPRDTVEHLQKIIESLSLVGVRSGQAAPAPSESRPCNGPRVGRGEPAVTVDDLQREAGLPDHSERTTCQLSTEGSFALTKLLRAKIGQQLLIIMPRERDVELLAKLINLGPSCAVLHGHTKPYEREKIIHAWRSGKLQTLIGTLQATLLPAHKIDAVVVLNTGTEDHFSNRRNPRLDNRLAAEYQARQHQALFITTDFLPRPEEIASTPLPSYAPTPLDVKIIDLRSPEEQTPTPLLSESLLAAINTALQSQKKVLLFYNRKGVAKRVQCGNCSCLVVCPTCGNIPAIRPPMAHCQRCGHVFAIPTACGNCTHGKLSLKGIGNAHLEKALVALFPGVTVGRVEKNHVEGLQAQIQLVTEYFFSSLVQPFASKEYGLVADLAADLSLNPENFRAEEETARKLHRLVNFGQQQHANVLVQTWLPDLIDSMRNGEAWLASEVTTRQSYNLSPFSAQITVRHAAADALTAITGQPFVDVPEELEALGRIPYNKLDEVIDALSTLPDTAVISIDQIYGSPQSPLQS